jgi:hypothetical protein
MAIPTLQPIPIRVRDGIADLACQQMTTANGYYYNIGDVNEYEKANVVKWPRLLVKFVNEENLDDNGNPHPSTTHYTNKATFNIAYEEKADIGPKENDREVIATKLLHDLKKFFGDYYKLEDYGCYQVQPIDYRVHNSSNKSNPTSVEMNIECEYFQQRETPTES